MKKLVTLMALLSACLILFIITSSGQAAETGKPPNGAALYNQYCVKCHGAGGKGVENFTPDLAKVTNRSEWLHIINEGKGTMPGFKDSMKSAEVKAVLAHIRSFGKSGKKK